MLRIEQEIRQFIVDNYLFGGENHQLQSTDSLLEQGILDSTGVLELVAFLQDKYGIKIADEELVPDNLDSLDGLVRLVERKSPGPNQEANSASRRIPRMHSTTNPR